MGRGEQQPGIDAPLAYALIVLAAIAAASAVVAAVGTTTLGFDFRGNEWEPARAILHGHAPYHAITRAYLHTHSNAFLLPPPIAFLAIPFAALPFWAAFGVWTAASLAAFVAALHLVGLRDRRCYALACLSLPLMSNLTLGQLSGFLALGCALTWRTRDRRYVPGFLVALLIVLKLLAWPLLLWLFFSRRRRAAAVGLVAAPLTALAGWAAIGFQGLPGYLHALAIDADAFETRTHSVVAALATLGVPANVGAAAAVAVGVALVLLAWRNAVDGRDAAAFAAAVGAGIYCSPLVHPHYLLPAVVALALVRRQASWAWLGLVVLWFSPSEPPAAAWRLDVGVLCGLALVLAAAVDPGALRRAEPVARLARWTPRAVTTRAR